MGKSKERARTIQRVSRTRESSGIVTRAKRLALLEGSRDVTSKHIQYAVDQFIPSAASKEKQLQIVAAVLECTDRKFLPEKFREKLSHQRAGKHYLSILEQLCGK